MRLIDAFFNGKVLHTDVALQLASNFCYFYMKGDRINIASETQKQWMENVS